MGAKILSGKQLAQEMREEMKQETLALKEKYNIIPGLAVILVGEDPASVSYVTGKRKACANIGIYSREENHPADMSEEKLLSLIKKLNNDPKIHGILVQLPLPDHIDETKILYAINPDKDVDGFHPFNVGKMMIGEDTFYPCTPHGIQQLLVRNDIPIASSHIVIVGRSNLVGKPLAAMLMQKKEHANATITVCHTRTKDIGYFTRQADIVVAAIGRPNTITEEMVSEGVVVIDVGVNRVEDSSKERGYRLVGDVDFEKIGQKASAITPVPGGVGPMTITMLLHNTIKSAKRHIR
ncbi:bifunctional methylenetetrahydrofolate dehydrogenase/methenyltetrahydrofolate cyclohydrolase FolD [bacterium]|nr:bifunctional methylenetetrahydrofolate dehydrogenase/methenyltetrahydrofolate cyclohydrolase FolD [bacterium]RQV94750.1 MAG: bifunctional methylenetetrahydrofolate dehydrogenase/methenyltetrahydrofolate cyclohydrolase FolD [bacterium]